MGGMTELTWAGEGVERAREQAPTLTGELCNKEVQRKGKEKVRAGGVLRGEGKFKDRGTCRVRVQARNSRSCSSAPGVFADLLRQWEGGSGVKAGMGQLGGCGRGGWGWRAVSDFVP